MMPRSPYRTRLFVALLWSVVTSTAAAQEARTTPTASYELDQNIPYRENGDALTSKMCRLDVYYPTGRRPFATVVWFHGGGLTGGKRDVPKGLKEQGVAVVAVDYRLSPDVTVKDCIDDAAASVAWVFRNIAKYGGSTEGIFVSGHSAGGYLTSMIGLDKQWLDRYDMDADRIAGLIPFSGHTITHFTARKERGMKDTQPLIDPLAPLYHVRSDAPPLLLITGDREMEMLGRYEENAYLWRMMKVAGHPDTTIYELDGFNHGQMAVPAFPLLVRFMQQHFDGAASRN